MPAPPGQQARARCKGNILFLDSGCLSLRLAGLQGPLCHLEDAVGFVLSQAVVPSPFILALSFCSAWARSPVLVSHIPFFPSRPSDIRAAHLPSSFSLSLGCALELVLGQAHGAQCQDPQPALPHTPRSREPDRQLPWHMSFQAFCGHTGSQLPTESLTEALGPGVGLRQLFCLALSMNLELQSRPAEHL